ncbi:uncharacterized protein TNCV_4107581 [Trichonephila clavipes]|nr:uncharacterized protein TNCV_4107581 [Trichonephila clavipes]
MVLKATVNDWRTSKSAVCASPYPVIATPAGSKNLLCYVEKTCTDLQRQFAMDPRVLKGTVSSMIPYPRTWYAEEFFLEIDSRVGRNQTTVIRIWVVGSLVVRASDSRPEGLGSMLDVTKYPPSAHGFTCRNCGGGDRGRVAIYRPFGEVSLSLNRTVTCMVLKANDRRTSCPCHDEFRGPRSDYVRQVALATTTTTRICNRWRQGVQRTDVVNHIHLSAPLHSARTIQRRLQQSGLSARCPLLGLLLTHNHRRLRRQWCDERRMWAAERNEVVLTDE